MYVNYAVPGNALLKLHSNRIHVDPVGLGYCVCSQGTLLEIRFLSGIVHTSQSILPETDLALDYNEKLPIIQCVMATDTTCRGEAK